MDALLAAGVDVFRINSSHGTRDDRRGMVERVRSRAARADRIVGVLEDLAGPKIRIGRLADADGVELKVGARLRIAVGDFPGDAERVSTTCAPLAVAVRGGEPLLIDDGQILLRAISSDGAEIVAEVEHGGLLTARKGINVPGVELPLSAVTDADMEEIEAGVEMGVDFLGVSFVQSGDDLRKARAMTWAHGGDGVGLVAKIERPQALERLDDILSVSDAVMVARGDLGLEIPLERVPRVQKDITRRARDAGVPVIVATQVFDTMRHSPRPTRAEVSDAANAVDDGVDAIMLAGETAAGEYLVLAVQTLDAVLRDAESAQPDRVIPGDIGDRHDRALCDAAVTLAAAAGATSTAAAGDRVEPLHAWKPGEVGIGGVNDGAVSNPEGRDQRVRRQPATRPGALDERQRLIQVRVVCSDDRRHGPLQPAPDFRRRFRRRQWIAEGSGARAYSHEGEQHDRNQAHRLVVAQTSGPPAAGCAMKRTRQIAGVQQEIGVRNDHGVFRSRSSRSLRLLKASTSSAASRSCSRDGSIPARRRIALAAGVNRGSVSVACFPRPCRIASLRAALKVRLRSRIAPRSRRSVSVSRVTVVLTKAS